MTTQQAAPVADRSRSRADLAWFTVLTALLTVPPLAVAATTGLDRAIVLVTVSAAAVVVHLAARRVVTPGTPPR